MQLDRVLFSPLPILMAWKRELWVLPERYRQQRLSDPYYFGDSRCRLSLFFWKENAQELRFEEFFSERFLQSARQTFSPYRMCIWRQEELQCEALSLPRFCSSWAL